MTTLDWAVLAGWLFLLVGYGIYRGRGSDSVNKFLLAGKTMPWYAMGLSIMATQATAITFISTTGQAYVDGMRFVQFYFGLPLAMVLISATAVPIFHRAKVYTAYEYLEYRFDAKTRALVSMIFLIQRGLGSGLALYAPAVVLSVILGLPDMVTTILMGSLVILYTTLGGIKAVQWADVPQMVMILLSLVLSLLIAISLLPQDVSFFDAVKLAGAAGRLNAVETKFDWNDRYNLWSGLIGGMFLALAYFGTDQSQVQRYLTGKSVGQSRLSLLFNAMAKIPMQFFILFIGAIVFVFFLFERPPVLFQPVELKKIQSQGGFADLESRYNAAFDQRKEAARDLVRIQRESDEQARSRGIERYQAAQREFEATRKQATGMVEQGFNDTNYIFLSFVTRYLPAGIVGLIVAVIFTAAMSSISGEINSLATVSVIDVYGRHFKTKGSDRHYLLASRIATVFWGCYAIAFANYGKNFGALIEAVNLVGSLFYGGMLGVFVLAFFFPRVGANGAFWGVILGEIAIFAANRFTSIAFLWYNVIGCFVVIAAGLVISLFQKPEPAKAS
ncbi:MAG: sodium:solute symporter [Bryobacteraceae bacterium]|nr:sodium:solute symporter [Bryobacteraceae bacterium]